jgi:hypothetical protein
MQCKILLLNLHNDAFTHTANKLYTDLKASDHLFPWRMGGATANYKTGEPLKGDGELNRFSVA